jgi:hypothetical protein
MLSASHTKPDMAANDPPISSLGKLGRGRLRRRMVIGASVAMSVMVSSCDGENDTASPSGLWRGPEKF